MKIDEYINVEKIIDFHITLSDFDLIDYDCASVEEAKKKILNNINERGSFIHVQYDEDYDDLIQNGITQVDLISF